MFYNIKKISMQYKNAHCKVFLISPWEIPVDACERYKRPVSLERSRSGRGGHDVL